jgi:hypothetical protein
MAQDIAGSLALLKGLQDLAQDYQTVMADGKVDMSDLKVAGDLFKQFGELQAAAKGVSTIPAEIKDLDDGEILQLATAALSVIHAFRKPTA